MDQTQTVLRAELELTIHALQRLEQVLEFLSKLERQDKDQFYRIAQDLERNRHVVIGAISENGIAITDLISNSSAAKLEDLRTLKEAANFTLPKKRSRVRM